MARPKSGLSMRGYWKKTMKSNPDLLDSTDNDPLRTLWKKDHPGKDLNQQWEQSLTTTKSEVRRELGKRRRRKRGGRRARAESGTTHAERKPSQVANMLINLELSVDEWIYNLRQSASAKASSVIDSLRHVRRELYKSMGH